MIKQVVGDLFQTDIPQLAHCVSADFHMGAGIALQFRRRFARVPELLDQQIPVGGVAVLHVEEKTLYYLVTKQRYFQKPTLENLRKSLETLRDKMLEHEQRELAVPLIGCGLDNLSWTDVRKLIEEILCAAGIQVTVYVLKSFLNSNNASPRTTTDQEI